MSGRRQNQYVNLSEVLLVRMSRGEANTVKYIESNR
jgi:hypothetical protein